MSDWVKKKLGDIAKEVRDTYEPNQSEDIPYVGLEHIAQQDLKLIGTGKSSDTQSTKRKFKSGDILFGSLRPYFRKVVRPKFDGVCSTDITVIRPKNGVDQGFLNYLIASKDFIDHSDKISSGSRMPRANWKVLEESEWNIPDKEAQQKIASILSAFDDLIENNTRRISILEEMARLIYREWFVHCRYPGAQGSGEQATPGHENDRLVDSGTELGEVPEGWGVSKIIDLYDTSAGGTPSRKKNEYYNGHIPWLKTKELNDSFVQETEEYITDLGLKNSSAKLFPKQSVLVAMYGATVGKMGILDMDAATNQACCAILEKAEPFDYSYLFFTLLEHREKLVGLSQGAAQQNINQGHIKDFQILKPDDSVLLKYQNTVLPMLGQIRTLKKQSEKLTRTRDLLLPKLISGSVEV